MSWRPLRAPRGRLIPALLIRSPFPPFGKRPSVVPRKTRSRSFPFPRLAASACASTGPPPPQPLNLDRKTTDSAEFVGISGPALQYQRILAVDFIEPLDREIHTVYPMSPPEGGGSTR